jgi:dihydrofolate reductase
MVIWHLTITLDGFIAGRDHDMSFLSGVEHAPGVAAEAAAATGAILAGRRWYDAHGHRPGSRPYGGRWDGELFVLTHHPVDDEGVSFVSGDVTDALGTARAAAGDRNVVIFGADIARQALERGLVDEFVVHLAPVMIGDGVRLADAVVDAPVWFERLGAESNRAVDLRYRPVR